MTTSTTTATTVAASPDATAADLATATGLGPSTVTKALARLEQARRVSRVPGGRDSGRKLGKGQLRSLVLGYLQDRPGEEHSPSAIGKALGRSSGAVGNALTRLAGEGTVTETSANPAATPSSHDRRSRRADRQQGRRRPPRVGVRRQRPRLPARTDHRR